MGNITVKNFQKLMEDIYGERDRKRGIQGSLLWFLSENGELIQAIIKQKNKSEIEEEIADVAAWLASLCNVLDIDLESAILQKYPKVCSKCKMKPCICEPLFKN